jgi:carboxylate-amine ligase
MQARPAREVVEVLLQFVRPALEAEGEWDEMAELVPQTLARGNGATWQRAA